MRMLVTGGRGQLANEIRRCIATGASEIGRIPSCYEHAQVTYIDIEDLDITDAAATDAWFAKHAPYDLVINCAAMTDVDGCEADFAAAFAANALGPMNLSRACAATGAKLAHVSTDYVFSGHDPMPRTEDDAPAPISAYGRSKLAGEGLALSSNPRTCVFRTAWLYGHEGKNFVKTMLSLGSTHDSVTVVSDQFGNPTSANDVAHEILVVAAREEYGTFHVTNEGTCSWADFAEAIMELGNLSCTVMRCTSQEWKTAHPRSAERPVYSSLENARLATTFGNDMRSWHEALAGFFDSFEAGVVGR